MGHNKNQGLDYILKYLFLQYLQFISADATITIRRQTHLALLNVTMVHLTFGLSKSVTFLNNLILYNLIIDLILKANETITSHSM